MPLNFLIIGQTERAEANPLAEWLAAALQPAESKHFTGLSTALRDASFANWIPDLIVIVQSWPDEFSPSEIASLFAFAPLARVVVAYGAWCESDGRNRHLWPLAVRVPLRSAAARIEREWRLLHEERDLEPLPLSASREEAFAADHPPLAKTSSPLTVLVMSPDPAYRRYLYELLTSAGHTVCSADAPAPASVPSAILFDADPWDECRATHLTHLLKVNKQSKLIAIMNMPRPEDVRQLNASGVKKVLQKLGDQELLLVAVSN